MNGISFAFALELAQLQMNAPTLVPRVLLLVKLYHRLWASYVMKYAKGTNLSSEKTLLQESYVCLIGCSISESDNVLGNSSGVVKYRCSPRLHRIDLASEGQLGAIWASRQYPNPFSLSPPTLSLPLLTCLQILRYVTAQWISHTRSI